MKTFKEFQLISPLRQALADMNYEVPTPIQQKAIPPALEGRDVLGCAQTGTGKTAAFALPILNRLAQRNTRPLRNHPQALILAPTRELIVQIGDSLAAHGKHLSMRFSLVYGGVSQKPQVAALQRGLHVLAATPGRLLDLMQQRHINLKHLEIFALDEVDRMLDMGFLPDIKRIIRELPEQRQSLFFSATLPPPIQQLTEQLLTDPVSVNVSPRTITVKKIKQSVLLVEKRRKPDALLQILARQEVERAVVFTGTKRNANRLARELEEHGVAAVAIHGNKSQNARQNALDAFQRKQFRVLVATDVASRGIDIEGITHVINFDLPKEPECYVHRIGRTGRAGESGTAISFCTVAERRELRAIEDLIRQKLEIVQQSDQVYSRERSTRKPAAPTRNAPRAAARDSESSRPRKSRSSRGAARQEATPSYPPRPRRPRRGRSAAKAPAVSRG